MNHNIPSGDTTITETLVLPTVSGGYVRGLGGSDYVAHPALQNEAQSRAKVACTPGVWLQGSGQTVSDVCFHADGPGRTGVLLARPWGKKGLNAHRAKIRDCHFEGLAKGIVLGDTPTAAGCDSCEVSSVTAMNCDTLIENGTSMAMGNIFREIDGMFVRVFVDAIAGGCNTIENCSVTNSHDGQQAVVLRTGQGKGISHNNGQWTIRNFKIDSQVGSRGTLIEMTDYAWCHFFVERGISSGRTFDPAFPEYVMMGHATLHIFGRELFPQSIMVLGSKTLIVNIYGGKLIGETSLLSLIHPLSTGRVILTARDVETADAAGNRQALTGVYRRSIVGNLKGVA
jgi:hypothetical protein